MISLLFTIIIALILVPIVINIGLVIFCVPIWLLQGFCNWLNGGFK